MVTLCNNRLYVGLRAVVVSATVAVVLLTGCSRWDQFARTNAEWANAREMESCVAASGGLRPYGYGHVVFGTGGAEVETCARIFGLPGAALVDE